MRHHGRWSTVVILLAVQFTNGCSESPDDGAAVTPLNSAVASVESTPLMTMNQLMHGVFFPLGNTVFFAQSQDPAAVSRDPEPSTSTNPLTGLYGGWQAVENSALALAESAELLVIEGRVCSNGEVVNVRDADWIRFVDEFRAKSVAAYEAALTKDQDAVLEASGPLADTCFGCHRVYRREPTPGDPTLRCIPGATD